MKVLVAAYACQPEAGSEGGAAWNIVSRVAKSHEVWVATRANNRNAIETYMTRHPNPCLHFIYHDLWKLIPFKRMPGGLYGYHYAWHVSLARIAAELHREIDFDLAHHLTLGSFRYPTGLDRLGLPLVIGPVGGAEEAPPRFWFGLGLKGFVTEAARWMSNRLALFDPWVRRSYRSAAAVLAVTEETRIHIAKLRGPKPSVLAQSGVEPKELLVHSAVRGKTKIVKVLYVARLVPWKGARLALAAFARAKAEWPDLEFTILGIGPLESTLRRFVSSRRLADVRLLGRLPKAEDVYRLYGESDIFLFPSLHDSGGMAVLEAMAAGLPVVCLELGGPAVAVTPESGVVVPAWSPRLAAEEMAAALVKLAQDPGLRRQMGDAAQQRAVDYSWDSKVAALDLVYQSVVLDD